MVCTGIHNNNKNVNSSNRKKIAYSKIKNTISTYKIAVATAVYVLLANSLKGACFCAVRAEQNERCVQ